MRYKWVEPFFKQDQQRSLKKSKSVNNLSCLHKRICEQYPSKAQMCSICFSMIGKNLRAKHCQGSKNKDNLQQWIDLLFHFQIVDKQCMYSVYQVN